MSTNLNQVAAERGYPSNFMGFTPDNVSYWREPGLPTLCAQPHPTADELDTPAPPYASALLYYFQTCTDQMAPRYPRGTWVGAEPLAFCQFLCPGQVLVWYHVAEGQAQCTLARLVEVRAGSLLLAYDKDGQQVTIPWWQTDPTRPLFRVTHYLTPPVGLVPPELPALLLELTTDQMAPRYPRGARYVLRPVPIDAWGQARGVHALALRDGGGQFVRRIVHQVNGVLVLASDRTGDIQTLPLLEVAQLWKLGEATYLPAETEAEHQRVMQRPAY